MLRTKKQREEICENCSLAKTADLIGDSCLLLIVRDLLEQPRRFGELETSLSGISTRTLTKKLKILEEQNMIVRKEIRGKPPGVEYSLTEKGRGLHGVAKAMTAYGEKYLN